MGFSSDNLMLGVPMTAERLADGNIKESTIIGTGPTLIDLDNVCQ
jgi:hypothetical protein